MKRERKRRGKYIMPLFIVFIFVGSIFGVMISGIQPSQNTIKYNGVIFTEDLNRGVYTFEMNNIEHATGILPEETAAFFSHIPPLFYQDLSASQKVYTSVDSFGTTAVNDLYVNLRQYRNLVLSCTSENEEEAHCNELPLKSCAEAEASALVFVFTVDPEEETTTYEDYCLTVMGDQLYIQTIIDTMIYTALGILP